MEKTPCNEKETSRYILQRGAAVFTVMWWWGVKLGSLLKLKSFDTPLALLIIRPCGSTISQE